MRRSIIAVLLMLSWQRAGAAAAEFEVQLAFQQSARLGTDEAWVQFVGYSDTRCPADVQCAWAGEAHAFFWLTGARFKARVLVLPWDGGQRQSRVAAGPYRFRLRSLEPRPLVGGKVDPATYMAILVVTR